MRVMLPKGIIMSVERVIAVSEQRMAFNGRDVRLCEGASDIAYANAIAFFSGASVHGNCGMATGDAVLFGNLSNGFVREVLDSLVRQGYVDLSGLKLQKAQLPASCYVFDNGASEAYMIQGYDVNMCCGYPFMGVIPAAVNNAEAEDAEDAGEEDDDE